MNSWGQLAFTKKRQLGIWKRHQEKAFCNGFWILGLTYPQMSSRTCALNVPVDGSKDDSIHCFKQGQPCSTGRAILMSQKRILSKLVNARLPMSRRHTRQFSCWTRTTKGTLTLKLNKKSDSSALVTRNLVTKWDSEHSRRDILIVFLRF